MNKSIKVNYIAFNQPHEIIIPINYTVADLSNYLRCICTSYVITDMNPTTRESNI